MATPYLDKPEPQADPLYLQQTSGNLQHRAELLGRMGDYFSPGKNFFIRVDFSDSQQDHISPSARKLLGLSESATYNDVTALYHPKDQEIAVLQEKVILQFFSAQIEPEARRYYKVMNMVRLPMKSGQYHRFIKQRILIELTRDQQPRSALFTYVDVEEYSMPMQHDLHFLHLEGGHNYRNVEPTEAPVFQSEQTSLLSKREREVLQLMVMGYAQKEVANIISLSFNTVRTLRQRAIKKLNANNINHAVYIAIKKGLIQ